MSWEPQSPSTLASIAKQIAYANSAAVGNDMQGADMPQTSKPRPLIEFWDGHKNALGRLSLQLNQLSASLTTVLRPEGPQPDSGSKDMSGLSPLAMELFHTTERVNSLTEQVGDLIARLDC